MSLDENWIWYPLTPASVPAGARISAGKSGSVLMSLPTSADVSVNCVPASCIPSPLSPAKRIVTDGSVVIGLFGLGGAPLSLDRSVPSLDAVAVVSVVLTVMMVILDFGFPILD